MVAAPLAAGLLVPGTASAQPSWSSGAFNSVTAESHPDWMSGLSAGTSLGSMSLPGTHDTLAIHGGWFPSAYQTQEDHGDGAATMTAQLNAGIRAIDIRVRVTGGAFVVHHTDVYQNANFDDVLGRLWSFLGSHPTETVVMDLHGECDANTTEGGSGSSSIGKCADSPSNVTQADRINIFKVYLARYAGLFYAPSVNGGSTAATPTLGQARGKVVLSRFTGPRGQVYGGYGLTNLTTGNWGQYVENNWSQCDLNSKWSGVQANMAEAGGDSGANMYLTYSSASCAPSGANPADMAGGYGGGTGQNQRALDYLSAGNTRRAGIVMMDYPGHSLVGAMIRLQPRGPGAIRAGVGKCLDTLGGGNGARVGIWACNSGVNQQWSYVNGTVRANGLCLDVVGYGTANGTPVGLWTCNGQGNQQWTMHWNGELVSTASGTCLDIPGAANADGTQLAIWSCNGGPNQSWTLP